MPNTLLMGAHQHINSKVWYWTIFRTFKYWVRASTYLSVMAHSYGCKIFLTCRTFFADLEIIGMDMNVLVIPLIHTVSHMCMKIMALGEDSTQTSTSFCNLNNACKLCGGWRFWNLCLNYKSHCVGGKWVQSPHLCQSSTKTCMDLLSLVEMCLKWELQEDRYDLFSILHCFDFKEEL